MSTRLKENDTELVLTGKTINLSDPKNAYMGGEFLSNMKDYIEALIYDVNDNFLEKTIVDTNDYVVNPNKGIQLKTGTILRKMGYDRGKFIVKYNFLRLVAGSYENVAVDSDNNITEYVAGETRLKEYKYFIHEISDSRKEVRLATQNINDEQYLRDFYDAQRTKKRVKSNLGDSSVLEFINGNPNSTAIEMRFADPNSTFKKEMVGGTIVVPNAFITNYIETFTPPTATGGQPVLFETEGDMQARFFIDRDASYTEINNNNGSFGDPMLALAIERFSNNGEGFSDNHVFSSEESNGLSFTGNTKSMDKIWDLTDSVFDTVNFEYQSAYVVIRSNSTLASNEAPTTYEWEVTGYDKDTNPTSYDAIIPRPIGDSEGGDFQIQTQVTGETNLAVPTGANLYQAKLEDSTDGSTLVLELYSKDVHIGIKLTVSQAFGGSSSTSTIHLPCIIETH